MIYASVSTCGFHFFSTYKIKLLSWDSSELQICCIVSWRRRKYTSSVFTLYGDTLVFTVLVFKFGQAHFIICWY